MEPGIWPKIQTVVLVPGFWIFNAQYSRNGLRSITSNACMKLQMVFQQQVGVTARKQRSHRSVFQCVKHLQGFFNDEVWILLKPDLPTFQREFWNWSFSFFCNIYPSYQQAKVIWNGPWGDYKKSYHIKYRFYKTAFSKYKPIELFAMWPFSRVVLF